MEEHLELRLEDGHHIFIHIKTHHMFGSGSLKYRIYTSSADSSNVNSIQEKDAYMSSVNYIEGETAEYKGIYDHAAIFGQTGSLIPDDGSRYKNGIYEILEDQNFMYRMRVNGTVYVSDMLIQPSHYSWIYNLFSNQIYNNDQ